ncbi:MAG: hypothetical protein QOE70_6840 [Chthoniobacter sp.]|jgi:outer membrane protein assembly factor BamD (BamD/ComL family)|nr:hypothetical protein [Chthoniobacter sp.]
MATKFAGLLVALALIFSGAGCEKQETAADKKKKDDDLWRARQKQQAAKYYNDLIKNYPDSPFAKQAEEKLSALGPVATPAKK